MHEQEACLSTSTILKNKNEDVDQIDLITEKIFSMYPNGIYFNEFAELAERGTSEFVFSIFDTLYQCIPCLQNHLIMRANYLELLKLINLNA